MTRLALFMCAFAAVLPAAPTFHKDVLPVLQKNCQGCHRPGEAAPMSLLTYKEARPWAKAIREAVLTRKMPPWFADSAHGSFRNDRRLADPELRTLVAWADDGAAEGDPKDAPAPLEFAEGWTIGQPDVVLELPQAYRVPASGTIEYTYFVVPTGFTEDRWVEKIELRPGARSAVHHIVLFARAPGGAWLKDAPIGVPYVPQKKDPPAKRPPDTGEGRFAFLADPKGETRTEMICTYVPGGVAYHTGPSQARLIKAGSDLIFQMHYTANGKAALDRSKVGIVFARQPPRQRVVNTFIQNAVFRIPPGAADHRVDARVTLHEDATVLSLFPHMHVRGKAFEYRATYPTGESEVLLRVPRYNFNWQLTYYLERPRLLPKGTRLEAVAWFDNSPNNPFNPDPRAEVFWGDQSWEEMLAGFVDFAIPAGMEPRRLATPPATQTTARD